MKTKIVIWGVVLFIFSTLARAESNMGAQIDALAKELLNAKQADVVKGSEDEVYISLGQKHGVVPGNQFEVVRLGEELKIGNEVIGHEETNIARIEIEKARDSFSIGKVLERTEIPEAGDKAFELRTKIKRLAIGQFTFNQGVNRLTKSLQEKLFSSMTNLGLQVVERDQLEKVLAEQKMGYSGLVNIDSAKKVGELLGAEAMILGSINDMGNSVTINARLVDLEAGNSISATELELAKTPLISQLLGMKLKTKPSITSAPRSPVVSPGVSPSDSDTFFDDFKRGPNENWESVSGDWTMANGAYTVTNTQNKQNYSVYLNNHSWKGVKLKAKLYAGERSGWDSTIYVCPKAVSPRDTVCFYIEPGGDMGWVYTQKGKSGRSIGVQSNDIDSGKTIEVVVEFQDGVFTAYIDGSQVSEYFNSNYSEGSVAVGMRSYNNHSEKFAPISFDYIKVTALN